MEYPSELLDRSRCRRSCLFCINAIINTHTQHTRMILKTHTHTSTHRIACIVICVCVRVAISLSYMDVIMIVEHLAKRNAHARVRVHQHFTSYSSVISHFYLCRCRSSTCVRSFIYFFVLRGAIPVFRGEPFSLSLSTLCISLV